MSKNKKNRKDTNKEKKLNETGDNKNNEETNKEKNTKKVLFFKSPTCPHCPVAERILMEVVKEHPEIKNKVEIVMTNTARGMKLSKKYGIMSVPTTLIIKYDGEIIGLRGVRSKEKLEELIFNQKKKKEEGKSLLRKLLGI